MSPLIGPVPAFHRSERHLWTAAVCISAVFNGLLALGMATRTFSILTLEHPTAPAATEPDNIMVIVPELLRASPVAPPSETKAVSPQPEAALAPYARTVGDQASGRPVRPKYIGERNTMATSDAPPDPTAQEVPAQKGVQPKNGEVETTESDYQDGSLAHNRKTAPTQPEVPPAPQARPEETPGPPNPPTPVGQQTAVPGNEEKAAPAIAKATDGLLGQSTSPVDVSVPNQSAATGAKPQAESLAKEGTAEKPQTSQPPTLPKPAQPTNREAGFRGNQRKTFLQGAISRSGRSALDVADSPLGRYQAALSRAVESEWQRNCLRRRDFITPGFQTVRFVIGANGKVRSVQFMEVVGGGEIQKGITLNSIREAAIPAMPQAVRDELGNQAMELIYRFYF